MEVRGFGYEFARFGGFEVRGWGYAVSRTGFSSFGVSGTGFRSSGFRRFEYGFSCSLFGVFKVWGFEFRGFEVSGSGFG